MNGRQGRALAMAVLAGLALLPAVVFRIEAPANYGAHGLTNGFGRGRLDLQGIVSEGRGGQVNLPNEPVALTIRLSGDGPITLRGDGAQQTVVASETPTQIHMTLPRGGPLLIESEARVRLYDLVLERQQASPIQILTLLIVSIMAVVLAHRSSKGFALGGVALGAVWLATLPGTLSGAFATIGASRLAPALVLLLLFTPLTLALAFAFSRSAGMGGWSALSRAAFALSLALTTIQLLVFEQPLPLGDPGAYFEMGGRFAEAFSRLRSPLDLGPMLGEVQAYLALPATGVLYGVLRLFGDLVVIRAVQALAMAITVAAVVSICETCISARAAKVALGLALLHPSFSILPGIVQPEPFILAAWALALRMVLRSGREDDAPRSAVLAGLLFGAGLALHPQGLSFLLLALGLCLLPWISELRQKPRVVLVPLLGAATVLLPVAAAERFSKPLAYVLDKQYGFFAFTSPHPLGFWLYVDSDGWQGPLRLDETSYQKELVAMKSDAAVASTFADVALFVSRHFGESTGTVLRNFHRLWNQPDNPFGVPFVLPYAAQIRLHRGLVTLFVLSLPLLLGSRLRLVALPFAMLSMTYPAYHVFNKYATPALPFVIMGAAILIDRVWADRSGVRALLAALFVASLGALLPATLFATVGVPGDLFLFVARGLLWAGLGLAIAMSARTFASAGPARILSVAIGTLLLLASSMAAARTDTSRGAWSASLDSPFEVSCSLPPSRAEGSTDLDPAWLFVDAESPDGSAPRLEANGRALGQLVPTMPPFNLATYRGHRDAASFRQLWRVRLDEELLRGGDLKLTVQGGKGSRIFGDIRAGSSGPRLSLGEWPHLSVYRLMHEGEYRLPVFDAPPQACHSARLSGRPGISLARVREGDEARLAMRTERPPSWIF